MNRYIIELEHEMKVGDAMANKVKEFLALLGDKNVLPGSNVYEELKQKLMYPPNYETMIKLYVCMTSGEYFKLDNLILDEPTTKDINGVIADALNNTPAAKKENVEFNRKNISTLFYIKVMTSRSGGRAELALVILPFDTKFNNNDGNGDVSIVDGSGREIKCPGTTDVSDYAITADSKCLPSGTTVFNKITSYIKNRIKALGDKHNIPQEELSHYLQKEMKFSNSYESVMKPRGISISLQSLAHKIGTLIKIYNPNVNTDKIISDFITDINIEYLAKIVLGREDRDPYVVDMVNRHTPKDRHYNDVIYELFNGYTIPSGKNKTEKQKNNTCDFYNEYGLYVTIAYGNRADKVIAFNGSFDDEYNFNKITIDKKTIDITKKPRGFHFLAPNMHEKVTNRVFPRIVVY